VEPLAIDEEVVVGNVLANGDCRTSIVTKMKDPRFDTQPSEIAREGNRDMSKSEPSELARFMIPY
jgi:hypothetical protein